MLHFNCIIKKISSYYVVVRQIPRHTIYLFKTFPVSYRRPILKPPVRFMTSVPKRKWLAPIPTGKKVSEVSRIIKFWNCFCLEFRKLTFIPSWSCKFSFITIYIQCDTWTPTFSCNTNIIIVFFKNFYKCLVLNRKLRPVITCLVKLPRVSTCYNCSSRGRRLCITSKHIIEQYTIFCHPVECRCLYPIYSVCPKRLASSAIQNKMLGLFLHACSAAPTLFPIATKTDNDIILIESVTIIITY